MRRITNDVRLLVTHGRLPTNIRSITHPIDQPYLLHTAFKSVRFSSNDVLLPATQRMFTAKRLLQKGVIEQNFECVESRYAGKQKVTIISRLILPCVCSLGEELQFLGPVSLATCRLHRYKHLGNDSTTVLPRINYI